MDRSFSIFQDNKNITNPVPYIKNFYILDFTTACQQTITEMVGYKYRYEEVSAVAEDLNHGAGDGSHFYLLPTILLDKNLNEGLIDYYENINHILDYGEFRHPEYDPMLRRGIKDIVIRSYDQYTQISSDNTLQVTTTSNVFSAILSKIAILKEQEDLTNAFLVDEKKDKEVAVEEKKEIITDNVEMANQAEIKDIPVANLVEAAVEEKKEIIAENVEDVPHKKNESAVNVTLTNEEIEFQKKQSEFLMQQLLPNILLLQGGVGDSNQIMQNIFMLTNTFMNNNQSILKNNKILADLSINMIEAPNKLTNNDTIDNKNDVVSDSTKINNNNKTKKSPNKKRK
jgi:hypothetical protein